MGITIHGQINHTYQKCWPPVPSQTGWSTDHNNASSPTSTASGSCFILRGKLPPHPQPPLNLPSHLPPRPPLFRKIHAESTNTPLVVGLTVFDLEERRAGLVGATPARRNTAPEAAHAAAGPVDLLVLASPRRRRRPVDYRRRGVLLHAVEVVRPCGQGVCADGRSGERCGRARWGRFV